VGEPLKAKPAHALQIHLRLRNNARLLKAMLAGAWSRDELRETFGAGAQ
jgi:hypothetical protein